jgi:hypothetical protein
MPNLSLFVRDTVVGVNHGLGLTVSPVRSTSDIVMNMSSAVRGGHGKAVAAGLLLLALFASGCGGGEGGSSFVPDILTGRFVTSSTAAAPNLVRLTGAPGSGDLVAVDVVIGGPTTSSDLYTFAFDMVIGDPTVLDFVDDSGVVGSVLSATGCAGAPVVETGTDLSRSQIVVGVSKLGACPGDGVSGGEPSIVRLTFRVLKEGLSSLSISGSATVLDSAGDPVNSIQFDTAAATIQGI